MKWTVSVDINGINFSLYINKLDNDEYEFIIPYNYQDYYGKSFLKLFKNIDDFDEYFKSKLIEVKVFDDNLILGLRLPYSKKFELVQLNKPEITEIEELKILIKKQSEKIVNLEKEIKIYNESLVVINENNKPKNTYLNLMYNKERGYYLDYDDYKSQPGANMKNLNMMIQMISDCFGIGEIPINKFYGYIVNYNIDGVPCYFNDFNNIDDVFEFISKPYNSNNQHDILTYFDYIPVNFRRRNGVSYFNEWYYSNGFNVSRLTGIINKTKIDSIIVKQFIIPNYDLIYHRVPFIYIQGHVKNMKKIEEIYLNIYKEKGILDAQSIIQNQIGNTTYIFEKFKK
jgi:hypothetical protein